MWLKKIIPDEIWIEYLGLYMMNAMQVTKQLFERHQTESQSVEQLVIRCKPYMSEYF